MDRKIETECVNRMKQLVCAGIEGAKLIPPLVDELSEMISVSSQKVLTIDCESKAFDVFGANYKSEYMASLDMNNDKPNICENTILTLEELILQNGNGFYLENENINSFDQAIDIRHLLNVTDKCQLLVGFLSHRKQAIGLICLIRPEKYKEFSISEKKLFAKLLPVISKGIVVQGHDNASVGSDQSGTILFDRYTRRLNGDSVALDLLNQAYHSKNYSSNKLDCPNTGGTLVPSAVIDLVSKFVQDHDKGILSYSQSRKILIEDIYGSYKLNINWLDPFDNKDESLVSLTIQYLQPLKYVMWKKCREFGLTKKQLEVALLIADGFMYEKIANRLCVSKYTVMDHAKEIFSKVSINNRNELANRIMFH